MNIHYERDRVAEALETPEGIERVERLFLDVDGVVGFAFDPMTGDHELSVRGDPHDSARLNLFCRMRERLTSEDYERAERAIVIGRAVHLPGLEHPLVLLILKEKDSLEFFEGQVFRLGIAIPVGSSFRRAGKHDVASVAANGGFR